MAVLKNTTEGERQSSSRQSRRRNEKIQARADTSGDISSTDEVQEAAPEALDPRFGVYMQHYLQLVKERSDSQNELDKSIITISSASIAASIALIKPLSDLGAIYYMPLIFISWVAFFLAILSTVESYRLSADEYGIEIANCYSHIFGADTEDQPSDKTNAEEVADKKKRSKICINTSSANSMARLSFYGGILSLLLFVGINFWKGPIRMTNKTPQTVTMTNPPSQPTGHVPFGKTPPSPPVAPSVPVAKPAGNNKGGKP